MRLFISILLLIPCTIIFAQSPLPRQLEEITFDTHRNKLLLFGGTESDVTGWIEPASVHEGDGENWKSVDKYGP